MTPVFFGSAMTNCGLDPLLDRFVELAPPPRMRLTSAGSLDPDHPSFSGFVFKIQANMDPQHRDRIAFVRICWGRFARGMDVKHVRTGKTLSLTRSVQFMAQTRTVVDEAYSGDIVGLWIPASCASATVCATASRWNSKASRAFRPSISCACAWTIP